MPRSANDSRSLQTVVEIAPVLLGSLLSVVHGKRKPLQVLESELVG